MTDLYLCAVPTVSGSTDGKCKVYFAAEYVTVSGWCDAKSNLGPSNHRIELDSVFGRDYQSAKSLGASSTTSTSFQNKLSMTTPTLSGTYLLGWQAGLKASSTNKEVFMHIENVTDTVTEVDTEHSGQGDQHQLHSGFTEIEFAGSTKTFDLNYRSETSQSTATIDKAYMTIWRVV